MRSSLLATATVFACFFISPLCTSFVRGEHSGLACLEELELPRFAVVNEFRSGGSVRAWVTVGPEGTIADLKTRGTARSLEAEVEYHLRSRAKYKKECTGEKLEFIFDFRVEGEETHTPVIRTYFRPPNGFLIVTQPPKMTVDVIPLKPTPQKGQPKRK